MDPDKALERIRKLVIKFDASAKPEDWDASDSAELCDLVAGLDEWLTSGGFKPKDWA